MTDRLDCVEVGPQGAPAGSVVWLHGLGADGHDFESVVPLLELPQVRFVFPHAPLRAVTLNMGLIMRAWYDITSFAPDAAGEDEADVRESARQIETLLERERERGVADSRIVLAGFSQGAAMALHVGTRHAEPLLGILVLSGYEVLAGTREAEESPANRATPLLCCHGRFDPLVPIGKGRRAYEAHLHPGRPAAWHEFPIAHEVSLDEIRLVRDWLQDRFAGDPAPGV